jgi:enoyl-CoA hydratase/carnithine racemase
VVLKDVLGLSDDQVAAFKTLLDARKQAADTLVPQVMDAEKALADALKATSPDATQLGTLLLKVQGLSTQLEQAAETSRTAFAKLLTTAQQQKVDQITSLRTSLQAGEALQRLGI